MTVDLLPFLGIFQYPTVPHYSTVDALRFIATLLPVVQHLPVSRGVEERKRRHQCCWCKSKNLVLITSFLKAFKEGLELQPEHLVVAPSTFFCNCNHPQIQLLVWKKETARVCSQTGSCCYLGKIIQNTSASSVNADLLFNKKFFRWLWVSMKQYENILTVIRSNMLLSPGTD